jgi:hypothetical protein
MAIESPIVLAGLLRPLGLRNALLLAVSAQVLTHPALWFCLPRFEPYLAWVLAAELLVTGVEAAWFAAWLRRAGHTSVARAVAVACAANGVSTLFGLWLQA